MVAKMSSKSQSFRQISAVVMFVDIEAFTKTLQQKPPKRLFDEARLCLQKISEHILSAGGTVSQTTGGGLLCYFTDSKMISDSDSQSALLISKVLICASRIQRESARALLDSEAAASVSDNQKRIFLPLRIGVSFGQCFLVELAGTQPSLVGEPVQLAKRLEGASEILKILVSPAVRNILYSAKVDLGLGLDAHWGRRFLQVKHQATLFEAWECNPFGPDNESYKAAQRILRSGNKRSTRRIPWLCEVSLSGVEKQGAVARIVDYSELGFCLEFKQPYARGEILDLTISTGRPDWNKVLEMKNLEQVACEIRWVESVGELHWHGVSFVGTPAEQTRALCELLIQLSNNADKEL